MTSSSQDNFWSQYGALFTPGSRWVGLVTTLTNFGAFVELPGHLVGLVHISEIADEPIESLEDAIRVGQLVTATILHADLINQRIGISLRPSAEAGVVKSSPIEMDAAWLTENAVSLAKAIRASGYRDREIVAILADALEEAGCEVTTLLNYCRNSETSVEQHGWWVAEAILRTSPLQDIQLQ